MAKNGGSSIQVIDRVVALLDAIASYPEPASLKLLSAETRLHPSTAFRILQSLAAHRVVYATAYLGVWLLAGAGAAVLAAVRAARRARCYGIGADIDDDAFAASPLPLASLSHSATRPAPPRRNRT